MATDPNDILLKLGLDASKFDNAINQVQKEFDTLGVIIDGSSAKIRFFTDATGKTVAKFSALSTEGDKLFATLEKGRRTFEFVNAGLEISAAAAEKTAKALERKAASAKKAEEADIRAAAAIQKQIEADEKRLTTLARSAEKEIQLERERQSQKLTASESSQSKKEVAELAALERINARLQKKRQDADDAELNRAKKNFDRLGRQYEAQRQADADKAARDEVTKQERLERINARLQKKRQDEEHNKPGFIGNFLSSASGGASDVGISAFLGSAAGGLVGGLASSALSSTISAFRAGITEAVNFERELAHLAAISASTKVTTDQLSESIINLSNRFNLDRNDVAKAKIFALQDGLSKTNEESDKLLETSAALAQSTGSALVDSTETLTSTLNAFGLKATDANRAAAILLTTVQDGKLPLRETNTVLGQLGTQLSPFGIRLEEVAGILSVLHTKSVTANESLTLLSNIFNRLANPGTNKGIRDFFNREGVANLDQLVASKGAVGILRDLSQEASKGSSELAELFGQSKSGKAAVVLVSNFKEIEAAIKKASTETNNLSDALKQVQNNAGENLSSKLNIFKNALLQIGDAIITAFGKPDGLNGLAKDMEKLAEASQRLARINAHSEEKVNAELTKQVETEKQILEVKKQLQSGAGLKPGTDVSLIDVEKIRSLRPTFKDQNGKIRHFSPNEIDPGEFSDLGDVGADAIKKANELRLTERQLDAIKAEQTRQAKVKELRDSQEKAEKDFTTRINEFGQQQVANAKESFNARQSAHFKMIEGQAEQEKTLTQTIKNNFDIQLRRADEEVHKIEEVAKKSESIRKDSLERVQSAEDDFETRRFQRQQKLFGKSPFLLAQLNQQRDTQLKSDAFGLVNALPNLGDDDFLASKNIEIARKKLSERTGKSRSYSRQDN
jgi:TP901 family phage tail tape measure protein